MKTSQQLTYTEGQWLPSLTFGGGSLNMTYISRNAYFSRIGSVCHITGYLNISSIGTSVGIARIEDLPFKVGASALLFPIAVEFGQKITYSGQYSLLAETGTTVLRLKQITEAGVGSDLFDTNFIGTPQIISFAGTYSVV
jgi:hypothetical protein